MPDVLPAPLHSHRLLAVDDDPLVLEEYLCCLLPAHEPASAASRLAELEKGLFDDDSGAVAKGGFRVEAQDQGEAAVESVRQALLAGDPYTIVFLDIRMPPGIDGFEAARQIRAIDADVYIVIVSATLESSCEETCRQIPPADRIFFFRKPFLAFECRQLTRALCSRRQAELTLRAANEALERRVEERTAELHRLAYYDSVTGLPNQLQLLNELDEMIEQAGGGLGPTIVALLDIDRFGFFNETIGHGWGTQLLRSVGDRLSRTFAQTPQGEHAIVSRCGADEFAVLIPVGGLEVAELAELVRGTVESKFRINGRDLFLKVNMGVACYPDHGHTARSVFRCAEAALHRSKREPRTSVTFYRSQMRHQARHKFSIESDLRNAFGIGQIAPFYQPQRCLHSGEIMGVEALARWLRPDGSIILPGEFIPLCEEIGLTETLFDSLLHSVCEDLALWCGNGDWNIPVSINISAHELRNGDLAEKIKRVLTERALSQQLIKLELTETTLLEDLDIAKPVLDELTSFGIGIHIDDFGTGYSSLSYLAELPVEALKIDRSFVAQLTGSKTGPRVVRAVVALAEAMSLEVIAEGVETTEQCTLVQQLGCNLAQGYLIARPMLGSALPKWCAESRNEVTGQIDKDQSSIRELVRHPSS